MKEQSELLKKFQRKYEHHINKGMSMHTVEYIRENADFDFDVYLETKGKNLQRELCWNHQQKESLIFTMLRNQKINPIIVIQIKENFPDKYLFKVIDGKQRLNTVFDFIDGKFSIDIEGKMYFFKDLPEDCQKQIRWYNFIWDIHYHYEKEPITDDTLIDLFEDCNFLGTSQDKGHLNYLKQ